MKSRIEELLQKYWEGETSLLEEKELKELLQSSDGFEQEKVFFGALSEFKKDEPIKVQLPTQSIGKQRNLQWLGWAASLILIISSMWVWKDYQQKEEERLAYEEVMNALALIQTNLAKGQEQMQPLNDLKYLNTTNQLFQQKP